MEDKRFILLIAGSRGYSNYKQMEYITDHLLSSIQGQYQITIMEGQARGADTLARLYGEKRGYQIDKYPADWSKGRSAGLWRNEVMVSQLEMYPHKAALFFWDGKSRRTKHCINEVIKCGIQHKIWNYVEKRFVNLGE